ncbi:TniQ family protein [Mycobacterium avium subsp. hominissuis]|nr:TniQ family protein [Mycobacterium avium subsp. hominissuis]MBZ4531267.1 TniQ family protein [Mycobacterium avium subsp. hominissuis]
MEPLAGEAVDSWLEATAAQTGTTVGALARLAGLSVATRPAWIRWMGHEESNALQAVTGVLAVAIQAMTLQSYNNRALRLDPTSHRLDPAFPFGALPRSRFCARCLQATRGRWQLGWRLGWSFLCLEHRCLLVDECPHCGGQQRRQQNYSQTPTPCNCACGYDLTEVRSDTLGDEHPVVEAQRVVFEIIASDVATFGIFATVRTPAREALAQIRSIANRVLNYASIHGFDTVRPESLTDGLSDNAVVSKPVQARSTLNNVAPARVIDTAVGVGAAVSILRLTDVTRAAVSARWIVDGQNADTGPAELRSCGRDGPLSAAIAIKVRRPALGPELQLRYRAAVTMPCAPDIDLPRVSRIAALLPTVLWREWADRLLLDIRPTVAMRKALSCATLLAGSTVKPVAAARLLGEVITPNALNHRLWVLQASAYWLPMCAALIRLSDYLNAPYMVIDYSRRRRLDYSSLLPNYVWQHMCRSEGSRLRVRSVAAARGYLIAELSGSTVRNAQDVGLVAAFESTVSSELRRALAVRAQTFLFEQGIDEPVSWRAPLDLLRDLALPQPKSTRAVAHTRQTL